MLQKNLSLTINSSLSERLACLPSWFPAEHTTFLLLYNPTFSFPTLLFLPTRDTTRVQQELALLTTQSVWCGKLNVRFHLLPTVSCVQGMEFVRLLVPEKNSIVFSVRAPPTLNRCVQLWNRWTLGLVVALKRAGFSSEKNWFGVEKGVGDLAEKTVSWECGVGFRRVLKWELSRDFVWEVYCGYPWTSELWKTPSHPWIQNKFPPAQSMIIQQYPVSLPVKSSLWQIYQLM